jgi:beta-N-acetylhexosaminidase
MNVDLIFAPVLDVDTNPKNPVIADRSLGRQPDVVSRLGVALIRGVQGNGVAACGKHFPGHGDTWQDSHHTLPMLDHHMSRLEQIELRPFESAIRAGVASIMSAHVVFRRIDPEFPATLSHKILDGILRRRLGFDGVLISDDIEMKAVAANFGIEETVIHGAAAGIDLFAICHDRDKQERAIDALVAAVKRGEVSRDRIDQANRRLDTLCADFVKPATDKPDLSVVGCREHQNVIAAIRAGTLESGGADPTES